MKFLLPFIPFLRSLVVFAFFLAPLLSYILLFLFSGPGRLRRYAPPWALAVALVSSAGLLGIFYFSGHWPEGTQVAWTGVEADTRQFQIGGARERAVVGWPNGLFTPQLRSVSVAGKTATLEVSGGGAFVYDETRQQFVNGVPLEHDNAKPLDGNQVRLATEWRMSSSPRPTVVEILNPQGAPLARFDLPNVNPARHRVFQLRNLVEEKGASTPEEAKRLVDLGKWAADKRLLLTSTGEVRMLGTEAYTAECALEPCKLSLHWTTQRLPLVIVGDASRLFLMFSPPWRLSSPLPPPGDDNERRLTLTATPRPDDFALVLPLGRAVEDRRPALAFGEDEGGHPVFKGQGVVVGNQPPPVYLPRDVELPPDPSEVGARVTSRVAVGYERASLHFATVNDLPQPLGLALLILVAYLTFAAGVVFVGARSPGVATRWVIFGLAACLWNLLAFRLLLAVRFALDPNYLDRLTVKGMTLACVGLAVVPGIFLLWARLRADLSARMKELAGGGAASAASTASTQRDFKYCLAYLGVLAAALFVEFWFAPRLWKNPPGGRDWRTLLFFGGILVYLLLAVICVYKSRIHGLYRFWRMVLAPLRFDAALARKGKEWWAQFAHGSASGLRRWRRLVVWSILGFVVLPLLVRFAPGSLREIAQEAVALFAFCLVPALVWLAVRLERAAGGALGWKRLVGLALLMALPPIFVVPKLMGDTGSAFATIPLFATVAALLLLTPSRRAGAVLALTLVGGLVLAGFTYRYLSAWLPGESEVRLMAYWQGSEIERYLPWARATRAGEGLPLQNLREAYQHSWESQAIAYEGGWWGMGYGNAPTRLSQVRQDTIQFDSLFSFFVASEHGVPGALALLVTFGVPLLIVSLGAWRTRLDFGYACAAVVCAWLFLEAVLHAGMNLGTFPFTGRSMPLVNVNSTSDLLRWLVLSCFAAQLLIWRDPDDEAERDPGDTASIIEPHAPRATASTSPSPAASIPATVTAVPIPTVTPSGQQTPASPTTATTAASVARRLVPRWGLAALAFALAALPLVIVALSHARLVGDVGFKRTFEWSGVLGRFKGMIDDRLLEAGAQDGQIKPDWKKLPEDFDVPDGALLKQEILRFNALDVPERLDELTSPEYQQRRRSVSSVDDYDKLIQDLRAERLNRRRDNRPGVFRLLPPERQTDGVNVSEVGGYRLTTNSGFNAQLSFRGGAKREDIPRVTFASGETLIGPAWVGGRWIAAFEPAHSVPWTAQLARTLTVEQNCFGRPESRPCSATLTLGKPLQEAATRFVSTRGRRTYEEILKLGVRPAGVSTAALPPRVALAVLGLPDGGALALGGYPRMTSSPYWQPASGSGEWLPPARWVEQQAPDELRALYGGDRNFDRMIVGSATKPMWAAAVLAVHPQLADQFAVRGTSDAEREVFGIQLNDKVEPWRVTPRKGWIDFPQYLALSDNRYHVRLGFLGLAESTGNGVKTAGDSPSDLESMNRGKTAWRKYPQLMPELQFSQSNRDSLVHLERTPLADHLERMFALSAGNRPFGQRVSFWTKNEADDLPSDWLVRSGVQAQQSAQSADGFAALSPAAPNFRLEGITTPRDYVSLLLGGRTNLWSNVDLASAFVAALTGKPFAAHVVKDERGFSFLPGDQRESFTQAAAKLRPGLAAVVREGGTAHRPLLETGALAVLNGVGGHVVYAKTGTLLMTDPPRDGATDAAKAADKSRPRYMSRIVLAVVRWNDINKPESVRSGLVFSLVCEMTEEGAAARWLGEFIVENEAEIKRILREGK